MTNKRQRIEYSIRDRILRTNEIRKRIDMLLKVRFINFQDTRSYKDAKPAFVKISSLKDAEMFLAKCMKRFTIRMNDPSNYYRKYSYVRVELVDIMKKLFNDKFDDPDFKIDKIREITDDELLRIEVKLGIKDLSETTDKTDTTEKIRA